MTHYLTHRTTVGRCWQTSARNVLADIVIRVIVDEWLRCIRSMWINTLMIHDLRTFNQESATYRVKVLKRRNAETTAGFVLSPELKMVLNYEWNIIKKISIMKCIVHGNVRAVLHAYQKDGNDYLTLDTGTSHSSLSFACHYLLN